MLEKLASSIEGTSQFVQDTPCLASTPRAAPAKTLQKSKGQRHRMHCQGQFEFNLSRQAQYFEALYIKYQNECAGEQRIRLATSRSRVRVPRDATQRQRPQRNEATTTQSIATQHRPTGLRSTAEQSARPAQRRKEHTVWSQSS